MNPELLLQYFDRISDAPEAIPSLRHLIFKLAVQGKLVEKRQTDESASQLLARVELEKARLIQQGKLKRQAPRSAINMDHVPFSVPNHWLWLQLREIGVLSGGMTPSKNRSDFWNGDVNWFSPKDIKADELVESELKITTAGVAETGLQIYRPGCLFMVARSGILKRTFPVAINRVDATANQDLKVLSPFIEGMERYLQIMFWGMTDFILSDLVKTGTTVQSLKYEEFEHQLIPLPPAAEQSRIVAKVDELMELCDRIEMAQREREVCRNRLSAASHHCLNNGADPAMVRVHADFYIRQISTITARPEQIPDLRRAIVSLAVRGQLVAQDPTDEPATELLKHIEAEKLRLIKEGVIGREKVPVPAAADELGFDLRPGWQAARISQLLIQLQTGPFGSSLHESDYERGGTPVINPASIRNGRLVPIDSMAVGPATLKRLATFRLRTNDIVMARRGEMGRCAVVTDRENGWLCGTGSLVLRLPECLFPPFFVTLIGSPFVRQYLGGSAVGATMQNLNQSILLRFVIGLPPLAEQRRIVAKVDELMTLCDRLEAQLATTQEETSRLLKSVLHHSLHSTMAGTVQHPIFAVTTESV